MVSTKPSTRSSLWTWIGSRTPRASMAWTPIRPASRMTVWSMSAFSAACVRSSVRAGVKPLWLMLSAAAPCPTRTFRTAPAPRSPHRTASTSIPPIPGSSTDKRRGWPTSASASARRASTAPTTSAAMAITPRPSERSRAFPSRPPSASKSPPTSRSRRISRPISKPSMLTKIRTSALSRSSTTSTSMILMPDFSRLTRPMRLT
ncbi:hypothetical protein D3C87_1347470 [compost metagenome]